MLDLDAANLRDWMASVGLLRLISETTTTGRANWRHDGGRYRLELHDAPADLADRCAAWVAEHHEAWHFADHKNVTFDAAEWRAHSQAAEGLEAALWCAVASDAVWHRSKTKLQASALEYGHGGGHQHWLASLKGFLIGAVGASDFIRILEGRRDEQMKGTICRWDHACERDHAYRAKAPTDEKMTQDQTINALAAIGLASCPSAPTKRGLMTPLVDANGVLWPVWLDPLRIADLEAALCCVWHWPTMRGRRWYSGQLICFSRGELREPQVIAS
jgi:hypothetical protein